MRRLKKHVPVLFLFLVLCLLGLPDSRVSASASANTVNITVSGTDIRNKGAKTAIQNALNEARDNGSASTPYVIKVPAGSYSLNSSLFVYSYTTLDLTDVTLKRTTETNIIFLGKREYSDASDGVTGYYYEDISIIGGTLDGNNLSATIFKGAHASNVSITGTTLQNAYNSHIMEVAGIDGLTIQDCAFQNQIDDGTGSIVCYEAVQLDVISEFHFSNYRSEPLTMKNVEVTGCSFSNVPRGVGSHTGILNAPFENIVISDNTFKDIKTVAIQGFNWINCEISNNTITESPCGIGVYFSLESGNGIYLASVLTKEGNTQTTISDAYKTPVANQNIQIFGNSITLNTIDNPYTASERIGIKVSGTEITKSVLNSLDNTGKLPVGNYYLSGVTIYDNEINTTGHGIRILDTRNVDVSQNTVNGKGIPDSDTINYYGIQARDGCANVEILSNTIRNMNSNGIYIFTGSSATQITSNTVENSGKYGIDIESAVADTIENNNISDSANFSIFVAADSDIGTVSGNTISNSSKDGIKVTGATVNTITDNEISDVQEYGICFSSSASGTTISNNTIKSVGLDAIKVTGATVNTVTNNKISDAQEYGICFSSSASGTAISNNTISSTTSDAIKVSGSSVTTVTNNRINGSKGYGIRYSASAKGTTISENTILNTADTAVSVASDSSVKTIKNNYSLASPVISSVSNVDGGVQIKWGKVTGAEKYRIYRKTGSGSWAKLANTTGTGYVDKTAKSGTTYSYTVRCTNSAGTDFTSSFNSTGKSIKYIAAPTLTSVSTSGSGTEIKWSKVTGASKYRVYRKTKSGAWTKIGDTAGTGYIDTTAKNTSAYLYTVRCMDSAGTNFISGYNTSGYTVTPGLPTVTNSSGGVQITWTKVTAAAKYRVYRKSGSDTWTKVGDTASTGFIDKTAKSGTTYSYTIRCINSTGTGFASNYDTTGKSVVRLSQPSPTLKNTSGGVQIAWSKVTGATGYYVYRKTESGKWVRIKTTTASDYTDTTAKNGTTYYYTVKAYKGTSTSSYVTTKKIVRLSTPSISSASNTSGKAITVKWTKTSGASGYQIQYVTGTTAKTVTISDGSTLSKVITKLTKGKTYKISIRSFKTVSGTNYYSAWSSTKSVKVSK